MAPPALSEVRAVALAWWREPGAPLLPVLTARLAALWTDDGAIVRARLENRSGVYTLVLDLERQGNTVIREWTPPDGDRQETLGDVYSAELGGSLRAREGIDVGGPARTAHLNDRKARLLGELAEVDRQLLELR